MHSLPLHPSIVHGPLGLSWILPFLFAGVLACWVFGVLPRRVWLVVTLLQAILAASASFAERTGEWEEDRAKRYVPRAAVHEHEEAAEAFVASAFVTLGFAAAACAIRREPAARAVAALAVLASSGCALLGVRAGRAGGRLVYEHDVARAYLVEPSETVPPRSTDP